MHAQPGRAARFEVLGGGVTRAYGVAHPRMISQLARAEYFSKRWLWGVLIMIAVGLPLVILAGGDLGRDDGLLEFSAFLVIFSVGTAALFGLGLLYFAAPSSWAFRLPAGTAMWAEFRPEAIGIGWLEHFNALYLDQIRRVRRTASVFVVQGAGDIELLIPDELVPPDIAANLLSTFAQRRPVDPAHPQPATSGATRRTGPDGVTRTTDVADAGLAGQLSTAVRRSAMTRIALALAILVPLVMLCFFYVEKGELTASSALSAAAVLVAAVVALTYVVCFATPMKFRQLVPAGAPISAEFGPAQVGVRLGGHVQIVQLGAIERIWHADHVFHVSARGRGNGLVIPDRLVPQHIASGLLASFGPA